MTLNFTISNPNLGIKTSYYNSNYDKVKNVLPAAVDEFRKRANQKGQFLSWVDLPKQQLERVDAIYDMVDKLKKNSPAQYLTVLGIGGSKHTVEHMLGINGLNVNRDKVLFYSDVDSSSLNRYLQRLNGDVRNSNFLVASKSGSTFETKDGMLRMRNKLNSAYGSGRDDFNSTINKHFIAVTDKNSAKSELRRTSDSQGWVGNLYIHDDVGGRFSAMDDHVLFTLAYAGMKKEDMIKMLQGAQEMSDIALNNSNIEENSPLAQGAYWAAARLNGINNSVHQYLGDMFESTERWHAQMQNESIKDTSKQIAKITDAMHHSSEAWYNDEKKDKEGNRLIQFAFALTAPNDNGEARENVEGYINAISKANSECGPSMIELLDTQGLGLKPETTGAMSQERSFATVYQNIIETLAKGQKMPEVLSSVLQPHVEFYKKNLRAVGENQPPVEAGRVSVIV